MTVKENLALIFGREPALWAGLANTIIYLVGAFLIHFTKDQEAVLVAAFAAILGVVVAFSTRDGVSAAILGFFKAALAVALGFGAHLSADEQAVIMSATATLTSLFVRTQATAKVGAHELPSKVAVTKNPCCNYPPPEATGK